jgi:hypothetical protein
MISGPPTRRCRRDRVLEVDLLLVHVSPPAARVVLRGVRPVAVGSVIAARPFPTASGAGSESTFARMVRRSRRTGRPDDPLGGGPPAYVPRRPPRRCPLPPSTFARKLVKLEKPPSPRARGRGRRGLSSNSCVGATMSGSVAVHVAERDVVKISARDLGHAASGNRAWVAPRPRRTRAGRGGDDDLEVAVPFSRRAPARPEAADVVVARAVLGRDSDGRAAPGSADGGHWSPRIDVLAGGVRSQAPCRRRCHRSRGAQDLARRVHRP